jgi:hypothetical protein
MARRKWTDKADDLHLKEVAARKAHIPVFGRAIAILVQSMKPTQSLTCSRLLPRMR